MNQFKFPPYLAFGLLKKESIRKEDDGLHADYYLLHEKVHEVTVAEKNATFNETFRGKRHASTFHQSLQNAVIHQFMFWTTSESPVFDFLARQTCNLGNIYFDYPAPTSKQMTFLFYPAVFLLNFYIPVNSENKDAIDACHQDPRISTFYKRIFTTEMLTINWDNSITRVKTDFIHYVVPLAYAYEVARQLQSLKMIAADKKYRMVIRNSTADKDVLTIYPSNGKDPWKGYGFSLDQSK